MRTEAREIMEGRVIGRSKLLIHAQFAGSSKTFKSITDYFDEEMQDVRTAIQQFLIKQMQEQSIVTAQQQPQSQQQNNHNCNWVEIK